MKLFSEIKTDDEADSKKAATNDASATYKILIISPRKKVAEQISSTLQMFGINDFQLINKDLSELPKKTANNFDAVIIDIKDTRDIEHIKEKLDIFISVNCRCILTGDNDSITFAGELAKLGISYFHFATQLQELPENLQEQHPAMSRRGSVIVSVLGCKGGCGSSTIAYQLLRATEDITNIPLLLLQGASGSADLDLISGKPLPKDGAIYNLSDHISVKMEPRDSLMHYDDPHFNRFNMIFIEHCIHGAAPDKLDTIINSSHIILLVISRELSSLRVAKNFLTERKRLALGSSTVNRKIYICLNNTRPVQKDMLKDDDIMEYIDCELDFICGFNSNYSPFNDKTKLNDVHDFAPKLLGMNIGKNKDISRKLTGTIRGYFIKK